MSKFSFHKRSWFRPAVFVSAIVVLVLVNYLLLPVNEYIRVTLEWVEGLGFWGPVVTVLFYVIACVIFLPGSLITLGAGFLFKLVKGTIIVSIGSTAGACAAFLVGRILARDWVARKVANSERYTAIDKAIGNEGFKIVFLLRLSPVFPFNLLNYAFGLTRVSFTHYAIASWIGMLPGTVMYVYLGSGLRSLADAAAGDMDREPIEALFFWLGLAATVLVTVLLTRLARRALTETIAQNPADNQ